MAKKTFELAVLISLMNNSVLRGATDRDKQSVLDHICGHAVVSGSAEAREAVSYLRVQYPKLKQASELVAYQDLDNSRYNKLIDLFRKFHVIESKAVMTAAVEQMRAEEITDA